MRQVKRSCLQLVFAFSILISYSPSMVTAAAPQIQNVDLRGRVELGSKPMAGAQVALWATTGIEAPRWYVRGSSAIVVLHPSACAKLKKHYLAHLLS